MKPFKAHPRRREYSNFVHCFCVKYYCLGESCQDRIFRAQTRRFSLQICHQIQYTLFVVTIRFVQDFAERQTLYLHFYVRIIVAVKDDVNVILFSLSFFEHFFLHIFEIQNIPSKAVSIGCMNFVKVSCSEQLPHFVVVHRRKIVVKILPPSSSNLGILSLIAKSTSSCLAVKIVLIDFRMGHM